MDGSIQTIINFVGTKPDVPVNPGNAASTGDSLGLICVIAVILICLLALFLNRKLNVFRNFRALWINFTKFKAGNHIAFLRSSKQFVLICLSITAAIALICFSAFSIAKANASEYTANTINAYVNTEDLSISVEDQAIFNDQDMAFQVVSSKVDLLQSSQDIPDIATLHLKIEALDNEGEVEGLLYDDFVGNTYTSEYLLPFIKQTNTTIRYTFECDTEGLFVNLIDTQIALSLNYNKGYSVVYDANGADEGDVPQNQFKKPGESVQLASKPSLIKDRYTLDNPECGWSTVPVYFDEGIDYAFGDVYATDSDVVLYVKWHQNKFNIIANIADDTVFKGTINGGTADIPHINLPEGTKYLLNSENNVLTIYDNDGNVIDEIQAVFDPGDLLKPHAGNISWENLVKDKLTTVTYDIDASVGFYGKLYTYTLDQLVEASNDLAANGTASKYYKEFSIYVKHTFDRTWDVYGREVCTGEDNGLPLCETDEQRRITNVNADNHWVVDNRSYTYTEPEFDASPNAYNQFRIIGINQDIAADGSNAGLTFMATHWVGEETWYHDYNVNFDGWGSSCLRDLLNYQFERKMPATLQQSIVPVKKTYGVSANSDKTNISNDNFWALSLNELTGQGDPVVENPYPYSKEGQQYEAFKNRVKAVRVDDEKYTDEYTYSVQGLAGISKKQSDNADTEFVWMRSLYNNWRTGDDFDDAALGISGLSKYPGDVYFHAAFDRGQLHGICPCFCLGSINDYELTSNDVYVSQWASILKEGYSLYNESTDCILKTYGNVSDISCEILDESADYFNKVEFIQDTDNFYSLEIEFKETIPAYGVTKPILVSAKVGNMTKKQVIQIHFDNWIYTVNSNFTVNVASLQDNYHDEDGILELPTAVTVARYIGGISYSHVALPVVYVGKQIVGTDTEHNSVFWYPKTKTKEGHFINTMDGKILKSQGSAMPRIKFEEYAFASAKRDEEIPGRIVGSLKGFDFSSLHEPEYGDYLFYGNKNLSEFKFNPDITDLPRLAFGGQQFHNVGLTYADLSSYTMLDGSIRQCFKYCDNIKVLDLSNTDSYYLEGHDIEDMASLETIKIGVKKGEDGTCWINWSAVDIFQRLPQLKDIYIVSEAPLSKVELPESGHDYYVFEDCGVAGQNITIHYQGTEGLFNNINDFALNCSNIVIERIN